MRLFTANFKWVMLISGLLTCTMFLGLFSPQESMKSNFGAAIDGAAVEIVVRNWAALIGLMGIMLIYGAFVPAVRRFTVVITGISKLVFISLVISSGLSYFKLGVGTAVIVDSVMVVLFMAYILLSPRGK